MYNSTVKLVVDINHQFEYEAVQIIKKLLSCPSVQTVWIDEVLTEEIQDVDDR